MKNFINIISFLIVSFQGLSQVDSSSLIKYTPDFKFADGIFTNFEQVKLNKPIPKSRILTDVGYDDPYFFDRVLENKKMYYYDNFGIKQEIPVKNIWGYSRNGVLYIGINDGFYRITIVGSICHFVANLTTYSTDYQSSPYSPYYDYYNYPYGARPVNRTNNEMRQYILEFKTGRILDYDVSSVEVLLMNDPELHDEFTSLKKKKKKQLKFLYIRKYNERNPLFFPIN